MMYGKLIYRNVKRSAKDYLIYIVTLTVCVTLFYAFLSVSSNYYEPNIGVEFELTMFSDGMKLAICTVALLLLFLIHFVNRFMLQRRQKEFAVQSVLGMEQKTIGRLFFAESLVMGAFSIALGIALGVLCSQFITAMLLSSYGKKYELVWTLFPDTVLLTVGFFVCSFCIVGLANARTIRKMKIIDMISAEKKNEGDVRKSRWMRITSVCCVLVQLLALFTAIQKMYFYYDARYAFPGRLSYWLNVLFPALTLAGAVILFLRKKAFHRKVLWLMTGSTAGGIAVAMIPGMTEKYYIYIGGAEALNQYLLFLAADLIFLICGIIYLAGSAIAAWKERSLKQKYTGCNLFFFGQILSKLHTTAKTMTLICLTLVLSVFLFVASVVLSEWASGYLKQRSMYDVQISSMYNMAYTLEELPPKSEQYEVVTEFFLERGIKTVHDRTFSLYLPNQETFHDRIKWEFPVLAMSVSDYNALREMLGLDSIALNDDEFAMQWQSIATETERKEFIKEHKTIQTDAGELMLAPDAVYEKALGETIYNLYTDVVYILPDSMCEQLLSVVQNRFVMTEKPLSYKDAKELELRFRDIYPEETESGSTFSIDTRTIQVNTTTAMIFIVRAAMVYGAIVLMVICLTILSLQQLLDASQFQYRFGVLQKLGAEKREIRKLIFRQLSVWFGLPIGVALMMSGILVWYFIGMVSAQVNAYIGAEKLFGQLGIMGAVLAVLLGCYFGSTWILFRRSIGE